jgi:LysR family transcriptional activator of nhaA
VFPAPSIIERKVQREFDVRVIGRAPDVRERFYAISLEAQPTHPGAVAICDAARKALAEW